VYPKAKELGSLLHRELTPHLSQGGSATLSRDLDGVWGGYFPGSSASNPKTGIEVHFFRDKQGGLFIGARPTGNVTT